MTLNPLIRAFVRLMKPLLKGSLILSVILCFAFQQSRAFTSSQFFTLKDFRNFTTRLPGEHTFPFHLPLSFLPVAAESEDADESEVDDHSRDTDNYSALCTYKHINITPSQKVSFSFHLQSSFLSQSQLPLFVLHHQWKTHLS